MWYQQLHPVSQCHFCTYSASESSSSVLSRMESDDIDARMLCSNCSSSDSSSWPSNEISNSTLSGVFLAFSLGSPGTCKGAAETLISLSSWLPFSVFYIWTQVSNGIHKILFLIYVQSSLFYGCSLYQCYFSSIDSASHCLVIKQWLMM